MATKKYSAKKFDKDQVVFTKEFLTVEEALQININQSPFTMTMRTPGNDVSLIRGLLHTEGVIQNKSYVPEIHLHRKNCLMTIADLTIPEIELNEGYSNSRSLLSVSSCGICGRTELDDLIYQGSLKSDGMVDNFFLDRIFIKMNKIQHDFHQSGGTHAAGIFSQNGELLSSLEDIGRHNAVDKVIGSLILSKYLDQAFCLTVSGRISYEIIVKCYKAEIPFLAAVSAPSSLAVDFAKELGITLFAFCRGERATCYSHPERTKQIPVSKSFTGN